HMRGGHLPRLSRHRKSWTPGAVGWCGGHLVAVCLPASVPVDVERSRPHSSIRRQALVQHGGGLYGVALVLHRALLPIESATVVASLLRCARHEKSGRICGQVCRGIRRRLVVTALRIYPRALRRLEALVPPP